jgi:valyl-tRNA synthetase
LGIVEMLAPFMPYVTEEVFLALFAAKEGVDSVHRAAWPVPDDRLRGGDAAKVGEALCAVARGIRRYKSEGGMRLGCELARLEVADGGLLRGAEKDIASITRAQIVVMVSSVDEALEQVEEAGLSLGVALSSEPS